MNCYETTRESANDVWWWLLRWFGGYLLLGIPISVLQLRSQSFSSQHLIGWLLDRPSPVPLALAVLAYCTTWLPAASVIGATLHITYLTECWSVAILTLLTGICVELHRIGIVRWSSSDDKALYFGGAHAAFLSVLFLVGSVDMSDNRSRSQVTVTLAVTGVASFTNCYLVITSKLISIWPYLYGQTVSNPFAQSATTGEARQGQPCCGREGLDKQVPYAACAASMTLLSCTLW